MDGISDISSTYDPSSYAGPASAPDSSAPTLPAGGASINGNDSGTASPALATDSIDFAQNGSRSPDLMDIADRPGGGSRSPLPTTVPSGGGSHSLLPDGVPRQYDPDTREDDRSNFDKWADRFGSELGGWVGSVIGGAVGAVAGGAIGGFAGARTGALAGGPGAAAAGAALGAVAGVREGEPGGAELGQRSGSWLGGHLSDLWHIDPDLSDALRE